MKKIGIISDTHAWWDDRYAQHFADCDEVWHAGDIGSDDLADKLEAIAPVFRAVCGNVDGASLRRRYKEASVSAWNSQGPSCSCAVTAISSR